MAAFDETPGHGLTHSAEADETDFHVVLLR
jgi:hypothetical protein